MDHNLSTNNNELLYGDLGDFFQTPLGTRNPGEDVDITITALGNIGLNTYTNQPFNFDQADDRGFLWITKS